MTRKNLALFFFEFGESRNRSMPFFNKGKKTWVAQWCDATTGVRKSTCKGHDGLHFADREAAATYEEPFILIRAQHVEEQRQQRKKRKYTELASKTRQANLARSGNNYNVEVSAIVLVAKVLKTADFVCDAVGDGAHTDLAVRPPSASIASDLYFGIQFKVTAVWRSRSQPNTVGFSKVNKYPDAIVVCVKLSDDLTEIEHLWVFHGCELTGLKSGLKITLSSERSKYSPNKCSLEEFPARLVDMLQAPQYEPHTLEFLDEQVGN